MTSPTSSCWTWTWATPADWPPAARMAAWTKHTLVDGVYTRASHLYHYGLMLQEFSPRVTSDAGEDFLCHASMIKRGVWRT